MAIIKLFSIQLHQATTELNPKHPWPAHTHPDRNISPNVFWLYLLQLIFFFSFLWKFFYIEIGFSWQTKINLIVELLWNHLANIFFSWTTTKAPWWNEQHQKNKFQPIPYGNYSNIRFYLFSRYLCSTVNWAVATVHWLIPADRYFGPNIVKIVSNCFSLFGTILAVEKRRKMTKFFHSMFQKVVVAVVNDGGGVAKWFYWSV